MLQNLLYVTAALLLVLLNGFFVAAEFALVKLRQTQAATLADDHGWRGRVLVNVHGRLDAYLSACQLGITLASLALGWIGEPAFAHLLEPLLSRLGAGPETTQVVALIVAFTLISYLHIVLGELAPKSLAIRRPEAVSLWTAAPLYAFYWLMYPAIWLLNASANWMLRRGGVGAGHDEEHGYSRDELKLIVHAQRETRAGEEYSMMKYALDLPELVVGDVMRTRDQLASLRDGMDRAAVLAEFGRTNYSRYPWFDADGDRVLGILHMKDLLHAMAEHPDVEDMHALLRPPILLPLHTPVLDVLKRFRAGDTHLALGVEDSGRVAGFFTLEDILEVLVGEIEDEGDAEDESEEPGVAGAAGELTISGGTPIYRLERLLDREIDAPADVNSVGGLLIHRLERLPVEGETLAFDGFDLTVRTMQGARAKTIVVHPHETSSEAIPR